MRIIGGHYKRTILTGPPDARTTRPLPDRVRESIFNMLQGHLVEGPSVFDVFAGTGSFGLEAISRGAMRAVFVERDRKIREILRSNIAKIDATAMSEIVEGDALGPLALARCPSPVTIIMMDPPYPLARDPKSWQRVLAQAGKLAQKLTGDGYLLLRTPWPFLQLPETETPEPESNRGKRGKRKPEREEVVSLNLDDGSLDTQDIDEIEAMFEAIAAGEVIEEDDEGPKFIDGPLEIAGAVGPETHEYGSTAVHWYQRSR
ncbi:MAG: RsmD family RNA methyltransferase [Phycisphaerales bacterium JB060]